MEEGDQHIDVKTSSINVPAASQKR